MSKHLRFNMRNVAPYFNGAVSMTEEKATMAIASLADKLKPAFLDYMLWGQEGNRFVPVWFVPKGTKHEVMQEAVELKITLLIQQ